MAVVGVDADGRCDDAILPVFCPTCQMALRDAQVLVLTSVGYFAWGCFSYFLLEAGVPVHPRPSHMASREDRAQGVVSVLSPADYGTKIAKETKELAEVVAATNIKSD